MTRVFYFCVGVTRHGAKPRDDAAQSDAAWVWESVPACGTQGGATVRAHEGAHTQAGPHARAAVLHLPVRLSAVVRPIVRLTATLSLCTPIDSMRPSVLVVQE